MESIQSKEANSIKTMQAKIDRLEDELADLRDLHQREVICLQ
jgi:hypothetical protein